MLLLLGIHAFLNELKPRLIIPSSIITIEFTKPENGLCFNFEWLKDGEKICIKYVLPYEEIRSIHDNQMAINWMIDAVNKELQKKLSQDLFKI